MQVTRIMKRAGASGTAAQPAANAGDIISLAGIASAAIGDTICAPVVTEPLQPGQIDPPTLSMVFAPNSSPIGRATGNVVTAQKILERLQNEAAQSVSLQVRLVPSSAAPNKVGKSLRLGRGSQRGMSTREAWPLGAALRAQHPQQDMRVRAGYQAAGGGWRGARASARAGRAAAGPAHRGHAPRPLRDGDLCATSPCAPRGRPGTGATRRGDAGGSGELRGCVLCCARLLRLYHRRNTVAGCACAAEAARRCAGDVISSLQLRKGVLQDMQEAEGRCSLTVHVPTRGLIGYKGVFTSLTRGEGLLNRAFLVLLYLLVLQHA